jgi:hypothetical protein
VVLSDEDALSQMMVWISGRKETRMKSLFQQQIACLVSFSVKF